tara:strand:- start:45 stop:593 length:549 start_codon:yes stop_codon:yes gene_type:complete
MVSRSDVLESSIPCTGRHEVRTYSVYALILDEEIVYIGKSVDVRNRALAHQNHMGKRLDSYSVVETFQTDEDAIRAETDYIIKFRPRYNRNANNHPDWRICGTSSIDGAWSLMRKDNGRRWWEMEGPYRSTSTYNYRFLVRRDLFDEIVAARQNPKDTLAEVCKLNELQRGLRCKTRLEEMS